MTLRQSRCLGGRPARCSHRSAWTSPSQRSSGYDFPKWTQCLDHPTVLTAEFNVWLGGETSLSPSTVGLSRSRTHFSPVSPPMMGGASLPSRDAHTFPSVQPFPAVLGSRRLRSSERGLAVGFLHSFASTHSKSLGFRGFVASRDAEKLG